MVMDVTFPDIKSMVPISDLSYDHIKLNYKHFILNCDIYIPENVKFVPCPAKLTEK